MIRLCHDLIQNRDCRQKLPAFTVSFFSDTDLRFVCVFVCVSFLWWGYYAPDDKEFIQCIIVIDQKWFRLCIFG